MCYISSIVCYINFLIGIKDFLNPVVGGGATRILPLYYQWIVKGDQKVMK